MTAPSAANADRSALPFDVDKLDALLEAQGLDGLLLTSPHNVKYLLGGYSFFLYDVINGIGMSPYMPVLGYLRGRPEDAFYVGTEDENWSLEAHPLWVPEALPAAWSAAELATLAGEMMRARTRPDARLGVELPFLTADGLAALRRELPEAELVECVEVMDDLRAVKRPDELDALRAGAVAVVESMLEVFAALEPEWTKADLAERLRQAETRRGLTYCYCLPTAGDLVRVPTVAKVGVGNGVNLDSGAHRGGYVADMARMGIIGEPTERHVELLEQVKTVQAAACAEVRGGNRGGNVFDAALASVAEQEHPERFRFLAHGMGLRSHEAPRLTDTGAPAYPATHRERPLEPGMAISVETQIADPVVGFVKLEDFVLVTADGHEQVADFGRDWNVSQVAR